MPLNRLAIFLTATALAACSSTGSGLVKPQFPKLPASATAKCERPPVLKLGDDLGVAAARWKTTAVCEGGKRASLIVFYNDLRTGLSGQRPE
jgi:hypothetical protein